jgi:hypothetical protein
MGQVIQVNGDYNIKAKVGSTITLDTGAGVGYTKVTGNLVVEGDTLTVSTENLQVNDNIIVLNYGEENPGGLGVTLRYSGIEIDKGSQDHVLFLYDDNDNSWNLVSKTGSLYSHADTALRLRKLLTNADVDGGDLTLIGTGTGVVNVSGTTAYELQVTDDDDIPNKRYVDDAIQSSPSRQIKEDDTRILISDVDAIGIGQGGLDYLDAPVTETQIAVIVDGIPNSEFYPNRAVIQGLEFSGSEIANENTSTNIYLRTTGTGKVQTNYSLQLEQIVSAPAAVGGFSQLFAKAPSTGDTGLWFSAARNGELISKNRALLYSMLF